MYISGDKYIGFKLEASPYTAPQSDLQQADFDLLVENVTYSANIQESKLLFLSGDSSAFKSVMGKQDVTVSFRVPITQGATAATAPKWWKCMQACGCKVTAFTTTGISLTPSDAYGATPAYIEIHEVSDTNTQIPLVIQIRGAMGNVKFMLETVGSPAYAEFEFKGVLQGIEDRAALTKPASYDTVAPAAVMNTTITAYSEALDLDKFTLDMKNKVELYADPATGLNGYSGARVARDKSDPATLQVDPFLASVANRAIYSRWSGATTGAFVCDIGTLLHLTAPALQIVKAFDGATRNSATVQTLNCILTRGASGNDEWELLQGSKT
jgi:hypothetical protein